MFFGKAVKQENLQLKNRNEQLECEIEKLKRQNQALTEENSRLDESNRTLKQQNSELLASNSNLTDENSKLKEEYSPLIKANESVISYRERLERQAVEDYNLQFERLKAFILRWQASLPEDKANTAENKKRLALTKLLSGILQESTPVSDLKSGAFALERLNDAIGGNRIDGESGFSLDEVLNPSGDLDLEALCKELGVMD